MAVAVGVRAEIWTTPVPSFTRSVRAAISTSGEKTSDPHDSADHTASNPASSAATASSTSPSGIPRPQYPSVSPSCTSAPPRPQTEPHAYTGPDLRPSPASALSPWPQA